MVSLINTGGQKQASRILCSAKLFLENMCKVTKFSEKTGKFKTQNFRDLYFRNKESEPGEKE